MQKLELQSKEDENNLHNQQLPTTTTGTRTITNEASDTSEASSSPPLNSIEEKWKLASRNKDIKWMINQILPPARANNINIIPEKLRLAFDLSNNPYTMALDLISDFQISNENNLVQRRIFKMVSSCLLEVINPYWFRNSKSDVTAASKSLSHDDRSGLAKEHNVTALGNNTVSNERIDSAIITDRNIDDTSSSQAEMDFHPKALLQHIGLEPSIRQQERLLKYATSSKNAYMYVALLKTFDIKPTSYQLSKMVEIAKESFANPELVTLLNEFQPLPPGINRLTIALDLMCRNDPSTATLIIGENPKHQKQSMDELEIRVRQELVYLEFLLQNANPKDQVDQHQPDHKRVAIYCRCAVKLLKTWKLNAKSYPCIAVGNVLRKCMWLFNEIVAMQAKSGDFNPEGTSAGPIELLEEVLHQVNSRYLRCVLMKMVWDFSSRPQTLPTAFFLARQYKMFDYFERAKSLSPFSYGIRKLPAVEKPLEGLTIYKYEGKIDFIDSTRIHELINSLFVDDIDVIGIDSEWKPDVEEGPIQPAVFQIAFYQPIKSSGWIINSDINSDGTIKTVDEMVNKELVCYIIDCNELSRHPVLMDSFFGKIFDTNKFIKLGFDLKVDLMMLRSSFKSLSGRPCVNAFDLSRIPFQNKDGVWSHSTEAKKCSLADSARSYLGKYLDKNPRLCNWDRRPLRKASLSYAAADAAILLHIYEEYLRRGGPHYSVATL